MCVVKTKISPVVMAAKQIRQRRVDMSWVDGLDGSLFQMGHFGRELVYVDP